MKRMALLLFLTSVLLAIPVHAQPDDDAWRAVLYDGAQLIVVTADGAEAVALPDEAQNREPLGNTDTRLSPDGARLVFSNDLDPDGTINISLYIADLDAGDCCIRVDHPALDASEYLIVGPFNPDGTLVTAATSGPSGDALLVVDVATGAVVAEAEPQTLFDDEERNTARMVEWTEDGILLYPTCYFCEGFIEGYAVRWRPAADEAEITGIYYNTLSARLANTDEVIYPVEDADYPALENEMFGRNVLLYRAPGMDEPEVLFSDATYNAPALIAQWVLDGAAYLASSPNQNTATLIYRDGAVQSLMFDGPRSLLAGTPEGWLMRGGAEENALYAYTVDADGAVIGTELGSYEGFLLMVEAPRMGDPESDAPVPVINTGD